MDANKIYTAITLMVVFVVGCTNNDNYNSNKYLTIPDSSFEAILIAKGIDSDGTINEEILQTDAEAVVELDLSTLEHGAIGDLSGIEGFINLKVLNANQHNIDHIDLSTNTQLESVNLIGNYLSTINLSKNTNLKLIDLSANQLTSIVGLSKLMALKKINLSFNYFDKLIVNNSSVEIFHMSNNDLNSLDISTAVNITNLLLASNKLNSINISTNKKIETLLVSDNKLNNINLVENIHLTHLYVTSNLLSNLDVSNNLDLVDLKVDRNPNLNCVKIANGQSIPTVSISNNQVLSINCQ